MQSCRLPLRLCAFAGILFVCSFTVQANEPVQITITMLTLGQVRIDAQSSTPASSWSFRNAYAGALGIAERIEDLRATTSSNQDAGAKKIATGEYRAELGADKISYRVKLSQPGAADVAHVSWMNRDYGLLMLADLLPREFMSVTIRFELSGGWGVYSAISPDSRRLYDVPAPEKVIFYLGRSFGAITSDAEGMPVTSIVGGVWPFKQKDALGAATRIVKKYSELTKLKLLDGVLVMIAPLPVKVGNTKWRAETRGSTVVLLIDPNAEFQNWIGQLSVIFTHELLHLWVPNRLRLEGDYDWFFEGFTLYTALRTALELKIITFAEYLNTLARVYDSYLSYPDEVSLIDASERRWTTSGSLVYDKGMLVAFLYDLKIRKESGGKTTLADRYRELFSGRVTANASGNEAIIALLDSPPAMNGFARAHVEGSAKLELEQVLPSYGLTLDSSGKQSELRVNPDLNAEQKKLLRSLGFRK